MADLESRTDHASECRAVDVPAYLARQCLVQCNFRLDSSHAVHQPECLQLATGAVLSHCSPFQARKHSVSHLVDASTASSRA